MYYLKNLFSQLLNWSHFGRLYHTRFCVLGKFLGVHKKKTQNDINLIKTWDLYLYLHSERYFVFFRNHNVLHKKM